MAERSGLMFAGIVVLSWITLTSCATLVEETVVVNSGGKKMDYDTFLEYFSNKMHVDVEVLDIQPVRDYFNKEIANKVDIKPDPETTEAVSAELGSILCAYCQDTNNTQCIKTYCFKQV